MENQDNHKNHSGRVSIQSRMVSNANKPQLEGINAPKKSGSFSPDKTVLMDKNRVRKFPVGKTLVAGVILVALILFGKPIFNLMGSKQKTQTAGVSVDANSAPYTPITPAASSSQAMVDQNPAAPMQATTTASLPVATSTPATSTPNNLITQLLVNSTPSGFLNVRNGPAITSSLVGKVYPGQVYGYVKNQDGWFNISLGNNTFGWVNGQYVTASYTPTIQKKAVQEIQNDDSSPSDKD